MFGDDGAKVLLRTHLGRVMARRAADFVRRLLWGEEAQATAEYAIVVSIIVALLVGISAMVLGGLSAQYREITSVVCLPIP